MVEALGFIRCEFCSIKVSAALRVIRVGCDSPRLYCFGSPFANGCISHRCSWLALAAWERRSSEVSDFPEKYSQLRMALSSLSPSYMICYPSYRPSPISSHLTAGKESRFNKTIFRVHEDDEAFCLWPRHYLRITGGLANGLVEA